MGKKDDLILDIRRSFFAKNPDAQDVTDENFITGIDDACLEYSRYNARKNRLGDIEITNGERYAVLPEDYMDASIPEIIYGITGVRVNLNMNRYRYRGLSIFDSELAATTNPPPYYFNFPFTISNGQFLVNYSTSSNLTLGLTTDDSGNYQLLLPSTPIVDVTRSIIYTALHVVDDDRYTIPKVDRDIFTNLCKASACEALANDLSIEDEATRPYDLIDKYLNIAANYRKGLKNKSVLGCIT